MEIQETNLRRSDFEAMHPTAKLFNFYAEKMVYFGDGSESINSQWTTWCACIGMFHLEIKEAKAQAVPDGFVLVRKEPNEDQWGGFARLLGRYMQSHSRYCPSNLKKYIEHFESIPDWLNREVTNWESDHAFATADLPVFIYKAMIEAQEPAND